MSKKTYPELRKLIKRDYKTVEIFAEKVLGITRVSLEYKLNGKRSFNLKEIKLIQETFNLTEYEVVRFFLNSGLQTRTKKGGKANDIQ